MMKKLLCILLAALMLVGTLASCGTVTDEPTDTTAGADGTVNEEETRESLDVPDTRYDGTELCFLTRDESEWSTLEIFAENQTSESDNISNAVFERNDRILQTYGVTITELKKTTSEHHGSLTNEVSAPTGDFQAVVTNTSGSASFASNGFLWNLNDDEIEYLDFSKSWWDNNMAQGMSIDGRLYFATGDLLTSDNDATFVIMFNKKLAKDYKDIPDLYALVENGEWTMDELYKYEQMAVQDNNGDGKLDFDSDICGLAYTGDIPYCMLLGGGITLCTKDETDMPIYSLDIQRADDIAEKGKLIFSKDYAIDLNAVVNTGGITMYEAGAKTFGEGHALFMGEVMQCVTRMRGYDVDFGILPYPKFNAQQANYCSMMHLTASCVSVPKSVSGDTLVMVTSMIEAMAYHAVDTLTVQYYEINLKTKGAKDEQSGPMMDMILSGRVCDLSYYYQWGSNAFGQAAGCLLPTGKNVASISKRFRTSIEISITHLMNSLNKHEKA
jgi:ABC-type glycerol-3-phosphate transport system substrate-binding protein